MRPGARAGFVLAVMATALLGFSSVRPTRVDAVLAGRPQVAFQRIAGSDRFGTAALLAEAAYPAGADDAVIATGLNYPDALAALYLAGEERSPLLLVGTDLPIPAATMSALQVLRTTHVTLVGLDDAIGDDVETALRHTLSTAPGGLPIAVTRIGGQDRYETMNLIDETPPPEYVGMIGGVRTALLLAGSNFPDALAAGPLAYARALPIVLTDGTALSLQAAQTLIDLGIGQVLIIGGPAAVSPGVEANVNELGIRTLARLGGSDRTETARLVGDFAIAFLGFSDRSFDVASADPRLAGADALALGPLAGEGTPRSIQLLTDTEDVGGGVLQFVRDHRATLDASNAGVVAGGPSAAPDGIVALIGESAEAGVGPTVLPTLVGASLQTLSSPPAPPGGSGSVVRFLFDDDVSGAALEAEDFAAYDAAAPDAPFVASASIPDPTDPDAVLAYMPTLLSSHLVGNLTLATVKSGAVVNAAGRGNPDGSAPIPNPLGLLGAVGLTTAPEALTIAVPRSASQIGQSALDIGFDMPTVDQIVGLDQHGFRIVYTDAGGTEEEASCTAPGLGDAAPSGGRLPGGSGTSRLTILCPDDPSDPMAVLVPRQVARVVILPGVIATQGPLLERIPADFLQVVALPQLASSSPDAVGATLIPSSTPGGEDRVSVIFDQDVALPARDGTGGPDKSRFLIVRADGRPSPTALAAVRSPDNPREVEVAFGPDTDATAVGVQVLAGAVSQLGGEMATNADDEVAVVNPATSTRTPGLTAGPVVVGATRRGDAVVVTFDQALAGPAEPTLNAMHAYDRGGAEMTCSAFASADEPFPDAAAPATLECDAWAFGPTGYGPSVPLGRASTIVVVTFDRGMVENVAGEHNPEQAATPVPG